MQVRKMEQHERPYALALVRGVFDAFVGCDYSQEGKNNFYAFIDKEQTDPTLLFFGCFMGDALAGVLAAQGNHIKLLFVGEAFHRQGAARALFAAFLAEEAAAWERKITVNASRFGLPAYKSFGFYATGPEQTVDGMIFTPMRYDIGGFALRPWEQGDAEALAAAANHADIAKNLRDRFPFPYTRSDAEAFLAHCETCGEEGLNYCIAVRGVPVGGVGVIPGTDVYRKSAEIGYWLNSAHWGKGIMTEAVKRVCGEVFERFDIVRLHADVFASNPASCRVLQKAGFVCEGIKRQSVYKNGVVQDALTYALLKGER